MKKYVKPEFFYERYELAQHIADCQWEMAYADENACVAKPDQSFFVGATETLFTETAGCDFTDWENYCYQTGAAGDIKVFIS